MARYRPDAEFELVLNGRVKETFSSTVDPTDAEACVDLLAARLRARKASYRNAVLRTRTRHGKSLEYVLPR